MRAGAAAVLIALGTSFLAMVGLAPGAAAHHANISGSTDCGGVVSWTATSWSNTDGAGDNAEVQVDYQLDGAGGFQPVPTGSPGAFDVPASPSFSGTFTVAGSPDTVTLRVTAVDDWGNGAAGGQTQSQTYDFPKGCNPPPQPPPPGPTPDPSATAAVECAYGSIKVSFTGKDAATTADIFRGGVLVRDDVAVPVGASSIDIPLQPGDEDSTVTVTVDFAEGADPAAFLLPVDCQHPDPAAKATLVCGTGIDVVLTNSGAQATTADIRKDGALVGDDVPVPPGSSTFTVTLDAADEDTDVTIIVDFAAGNDLRSTIAVDCVPVVPPPPPPPPLRSTSAPTCLARRPILTTARPRSTCARISPAPRPTPRTARCPSTSAR